jgi:hypothetical protein
MRAAIIALFSIASLSAASAQWETRTKSGPRLGGPEARGSYYDRARAAGYTTRGASKMAYRRQVKKLRKQMGLPPGPVR